MGNPKDRDRERQVYIRNLARAMMGVLKFNMNNVVVDDALAQDVWQQCYDGLWAVSLTWSDATLGRIGACGLGYGANRRSGDSHKTSLYAVHRTRYLDEFDAGYDLHRVIAVTAIIAAITDLVIEFRKPSAPIPVASPGPTSSVHPGLLPHGCDS